MKKFLPIETLDRHFQHRMLEVHTCAPYKVLAYDASAQTVDVQPQIKRYFLDEDGRRTAEALPKLYGVPVGFPRAGGFHISMPIIVGDFVLVVFGEEPTQAWRQKAREVEPGFLDRHGLNGAFALPCGFPDAEKLGTAPPTDAIVISANDGSGSVTVKAGAVLLGDNTASDFVALASKVAIELADLRTAYNAHKHLGVTTGVGTSGLVVTPLGVFSSVAAAKTKAK